MFIRVTVNSTEKISTAAAKTWNTRGQMVLSVALITVFAHSGATTFTRENIFTFRFEKNLWMMCLIQHLHLAKKKLAVSSTRDDNQYVYMTFGKNK